MSDRALRAEIDSLRGIIEALRIDVRELGERVSELEGGGSQLLSSPPRAPSIAAASAKSASTPTGHYSLVSGSPSTRGIISVEDTEARAQLAREIGDFIRRALEGNFRGTSGRDRLRLASKLYLVFANFFGNRLNPPRTSGKPENFGSTSSCFLHFLKCHENRFLTETPGKKPILD